MPNCLTFQQTSSSYVPASLKHDTNGWYIVYYGYNAVLNGLERKRIKINQLRKRCKTSLEFRIQVDQIMNTINTHLRMNSMMMASQGVVPAPPTMATVTKAPELVEVKRQALTVKEVLDIFIDTKEKRLRPSTMDSYRSFRNILMGWIDKNHPKIEINKFTNAIAVEFLDKMENREDICAATYNNFIKLGSAFFGWANKKCYCETNPFSGKERLQVDEKKRTIIPADHQQLIDQWFAEHQPAMQIICRMVYTSLLRPVEIARVQVKQIDFEHHCIVMPQDKTKTHEERNGRLDKELEDMLRRHIAGAKPDDYLFADSQWRCGKVPMSCKMYCKAWVRMRDKVKVEIDGRLTKMPDSYQLYSLKDSALFSMIKAGVDDLSAMQAAGHKDLSMTTRYVNHYDKDLIDNLNNKAPKFAQVG